MRVLLGPAFALLLLVIASAPAAAQLAPGTRVDITRVEGPATVVADKAFPLTVELVNRQDEPQRVLLFAAMYEHVEGKECGSATDPRFRGFIHRVQPDVSLGPGESARYPPERDPMPWWQLANASAVGGDPTVEICVFAATTEAGAGATLTYLDYWRFAVNARLQNAAPTADFTWTPAVPNATMPVRFEATGEDADGDAITFTWDFGHSNASGRARAEGARAVHPFYPEGVYTVTLTARDAWDRTVVTREVRVLPESEPAVGPLEPTVASGGRAWWAIPGPVALAGVALAVAAGLRRR